MNLLVIINIILEIVAAFLGINIIWKLEKVIKQLIYNKIYKNKLDNEKTLQNKNYEKLILDETYSINKVTQNNNINLTEIMTTNPDAEKVKNIISNFEQNFPIENLQIFYQKLKDIKLEFKPITKKTNNVASYWDYSNLITYNQNSLNNLKYYLSHECLHMSSSFVLNEYIFSGFSQQQAYHIDLDGNILDSNFQIGKSINEGYTELLNARLHEDNKLIAYQNQAKLVRLIELFFDDPIDMQNLYFQANLIGLIKHLQIFAKKEDIITLIMDSDRALWLYEKVYGKDNNFIPSIINLKVQLKLYKWFIQKCTDKEKINRFEEILFEDRLTKMIIKHEKTKLYKKDFAILKSKQKHL